MTGKLTLALLSDFHCSAAQQAIACVLDALTEAHLPRVAPIKVGYLASAHEPERDYYRQTQVAYAALGAELCCYTDLQQDYSASALQALYQCDAIHLAGGDTFAFLAAIQQRGAMECLQAFAAKGAAMIGLSAGAMLMTPNITSASLCGDHNQVQLDNLSALGLLPYQFVPHVDFSQHGVDISVAAAQLIASQELAQYPLILCADSDALVYREPQLIGFGQPLLFDGVALMALT